MTFLQKSYGEYSKVEKPGVVTTSYEGLNDDEELKTVLIVIFIKIPNVTKNDSIFFPKKLLMMKLKQPPHPLSMPKWFMQWKKYKFCSMTMPTKLSSKLHKRKMPSKIFVNNDTKPAAEEPKTRNEDCSQQNENSCKNGKKWFIRNLPMWTSKKYCAWQVKVLCTLISSASKKWVFKI